MKTTSSSRRRFLQGAASLGALTALSRLAPAYASTTGGRQAADASTLSLAVHRVPLVIDGRTAHPVTVNGSVPGPLVRLREGTTATIEVTNHLDADTSVHWHGIILPNAMDGVPGVTYRGIRPGETFVYRFPVHQNGTYWYHSHSGLQEQVGHYGPLIIDPAEPEPFRYDRDYVVMLSDWTFEDPHEVLAHLKQSADYYNYHRRTVGDFFHDLENKGWSATWADRSMWDRMRMSPTDIADVTGATYTYLMNGLPTASNWTGLFRPGERLRLRFINGSAMTYFDVRIPGLKMTVVAADGQFVRPVPVDEFRIGVAETYDVIVEPTAEAHTVFAEAMDRSGFTRGTLATRAGLSAPIPPRRKPPLRGMAAMGMEMDDMSGMSGMAMDSPSESGAMANPGGMGGMEGSMASNSAPTAPAMGGMGGQSKPAAMDGTQPMPAGGMPGMNMGGAHTARADAEAGLDHRVPEHFGPGAAMVAEHPRNRLNDPGVGLENNGRRVLVYADLRSLHPWPDRRPPGRTIELHLTGNMDRYMWSFDGKKFSEVDGPIRFRYGERLRLRLVNDTMMDHPIHLHGMWMELDNGAGPYKPRKHTISLKPGEFVDADISADAPGDWAFHCHLLYHMKAGMFRVVSVA